MKIKFRRLVKPQQIYCCTSNRIDGNDEQQNTVRELSYGRDRGGGEDARA